MPITKNVEICIEEYACLKIREFLIEALISGHIDSVTFLALANCVYQYTYEGGITSA